MGTIVAVRKGEQAVLATNCWSTRDYLVKPTLTQKHDCIYRIGSVLVGINAAVAFQQAFESFIIRNKEMLTKADLTNRHGVYAFFHSVHQVLLQHAALQTQFQQHQDFEWTPMTALVLAPQALFKVDSARGVFELHKFWAIGSAESCAHGALFTAYNLDLSAEQIARAALSAAAEFGNADLGEHRIFTLEMARLDDEKQRQSSKGMRRSKAAKRQVEEDGVH
jgi:ATP-dependent HslUV protease subunit HslV